MPRHENKRATVKSVKADVNSKTKENRVYDALVKTVMTVLVSSTQRKFTDKTILDASVIVVKASAEQSSANSARKKMACGTSRRQAVKPLESLVLVDVMKNINKQLRRDCRKEFCNQSITVSMDIHDIPYHGKPFKFNEEVRGGKQKDGTRRFHGFATAYANVNNHRITLAVMFVPNHTGMCEVVHTLLTLVRRAGIRAKMLFLDKGFYSVDVIRLLKRFNTPFIMPLRGKRLKKKRGSYRTEYAVRSGANGEEVVAAYSVIKYDAGKRFGKHGARQLQYITWHVGLPPRKVAEAYRKRFGIESSYKLSKKKRPRTSSRNPAYRAFLFAASIFLQNAWVKVKRAYCLRVKKWSHEFIALQDFTNVLLAIVRQQYGEITSFKVLS
jgi:putative transposase